ncbi:protein Skeletor, isoforms B/C-like [Eriocheir sinensis]|uniref:protein Skeletor, isoforms B/C-like n=1 Tax=Eriocheir sinensis TaxID=95602 RepID=UPI0021C87921|nr:protein Skeletor, isoforms B/C-like [Eriocheir sinensis]XP_050710406.1 protein Skeletor, isoforms B/C-like [Eriocheir sinensis]
MALARCVWVLAFTWCLGVCSASDGYVGKKIGEMNSYHHQVGGDVYAVDETTLLIKNFMYDGNGGDTFFWAGSRPRPGPQGFIVPNELGRTNVLDRYLNKDITLTLPDQKTITEIKWLAIYDLSRLEPFGDIYIPEGFEPPQKIVLNKLSSKTKEVQSGGVVIADSKTIVIEDFSYNGRGTDVHFWVGVGPQPHSKGNKIPDEHGYMTPLQKYRKKTITLELPGDLTVFTVDWLAIYDITEDRVLGSIIIPEELNVPPSLVEIIPHTNAMPNCEQLHRDMMVSWDVYADQITVELAGQVGEDDYMAFGMSGSPTEPKMDGGDVAVVHMDGYLGSLRDYNLSSYMPCTKLLEQHKGVCDDEKVDNKQDYQEFSSKRENGLNIFTFRRRLGTPDPGDIPYPDKGEAMIIWAMGHLDHNREPTMHYAWSKYKQPIEFTRKATERKCFAFTRAREEKPKLRGWKRFHLADPAAKEFNATIGPDGGPRGYESITGQNAESGLAWYINGFLSPDLYIKRNTKYRFLVMGGSNPHDPKSYHPLIITDEPHGAYSQLTEEEQKDVRVLAGIGYSVRGNSRPTAAGRLCLWEHPPDLDRRKDVEFTTFEHFRNLLHHECGEGKPAVLEFTPNKSWPDIVYYNSWTAPNMGWRMHILDEINTEKILEAAASSSPGLHGSHWSSVYTMMLWVTGVWLVLLVV